MNALTSDQLTRAAEIFEAARARTAATTAPIIDAPKPFDPIALSDFYIREMEQAAAPAKIADILYSYTPSLLSPAQRWERLPKTTRRILEAFELASGTRLKP